MRAIIISGQFPLAHGAFMGVGAYAGALVSKLLFWPPWFAIPFGGLVAMALGVVIGLPFARLRALYYAMGSLFFGIAVINVISSLGFTGGLSGITGIPPLFTSMQSYYYFFLGLTVLCLLAIYRFEHSRIGTNLKSISQSYLVASSVGINEFFYKIFAVGFGCFFVGVAGAAYANYNQVIMPQSFGFMTTLWMAMYVLVGGVNNFAGPIIGTFALLILTELFSGSETVMRYTPYVSAGILLIAAYFMKGGLVSLPRLVISLFSKFHIGKTVKNAP
jgi:branched-chain amino acid transport system permease protein